LVNINAYVRVSNPECKEYLILPPCFCTCFNFALHPDAWLWNCSLGDASWFLKNPGFAMQVIPHEQTRRIPISDEESRLDFSSHLRDDQYLQVEIDLSASKS
jgi:hypothetical protein